MIRRPPRSTLFPYTTALPIFHQLLTHTSGVPIPTYSGPAWERYSALAASPVEFLDLVRDKPLLYSHGTKLTYNNRSEEHTSELQSQSNLVCRLLLEQKKNSHI